MYSKKKVRKFVETLNSKWFYFETIQGKKGAPDSLLRIFKIINPATRYKLYMYTKYKTYIWNMLIPFKLFIRLVKKMERILLGYMQIENKQK